MFRSQETIKAFIDILKYRDVSLFHACQLKDFQSYINIRGIPSRKFLEQYDLPYTSFDTDENDKHNDVWNKVFVNLEDFGVTFANGGSAVPNPYGPILFKINAAAFSDATEVAVTLRSAGAKNFNRQHESLKSLNDFNRIFRRLNGPHVKYKDDLRVAFPEKPSKEVESVEIHCDFPNGCLPLKYVEEVIVDPYQFNDIHLATLVNSKRLDCDVKFGISIRNPPVAMRKDFYIEIAKFLIHWNHLKGYFPKFEDLRLYSSSSDIQQWANCVRGIDWQFDRFAKYLYNGTLRYVSHS